MSRSTAAVLLKREPIPPRPPAFETAAASSAEVQVPIGARMMGTSIPYRSQRGVLNISIPSIRGDEMWRIAPNHGWANAGDLVGSGQRAHHVRFGSKADICAAKRHVCFSDRESGHQ